MTQADTSIIAPLSDTETSVLRAYARNDVVALRALNTAAKDGVPQLWYWAGTVEALKTRGFLQSHERGMLVTPEGLAAALG